MTILHRSQSRPLPLIQEVTTQLTCPYPRRPALPDLDLRPSLSSGMCLTAEARHPPGMGIRLKAPSQKPLSLYALATLDLEGWLTLALAIVICRGGQAYYKFIYFLSSGVSLHRRLSFRN